MSKLFMISELHVSLPNISPRIDILCQGVNIITQYKYWVLLLLNIFDKFHFYLYENTQDPIFIYRAGVNKISFLFMVGVLMKYSRK